MRVAKCHSLATCINTIGSYMCQCPDGYSGDGVSECYHDVKDKIYDVHCEKDGITLIFTKKMTGKIYVKSQSENPKCSMNVSSSDQPPYKFKVFYDYCDVHKEGKDTLAVVVIRQRHPYFITRGDNAIKAMCTYPSGETEIESSLEVARLTTVESLVLNTPKAQCSLTIVHPDSLRPAISAEVGEVLRLRMSVLPSDIYGNSAKNCVALNMKTGESYNLTDERGCSLDHELFGAWKKVNDSVMTADFTSFKWPDASSLRIQCDCTVCFNRCPEIQCNKRYKSKRHTPAISDVAVQQSRNVHSNVLVVTDKSDLTDELPTDPLLSTGLEAEVDDGTSSACVSGVLLATVIGVVVVALSTLGSLCIYKQCISPNGPTKRVPFYQSRSIPGLNTNPFDYRKCSDRTSNYNR
ncbi:unnamed protein product [Soboliphyme baturini]|uniref:ZP domain-containing protein n=1 Tax=Soboliphyme baturini TaxID=241478 RepID=A0A183IWK3_9BILA|nr:unnamed protein product [Soboliphyme baturini]